jgi:hypothetical protein
LISSLKVTEFMDGPAQAALFVKCSTLAGSGGHLDAQQLGAFADLVAAVQQLQHHAIAGAAMVCSIFMASITASGCPC